LQYCTPGIQLIREISADLGDLGEAGAICTGILGRHVILKFQLRECGHHPVPPIPPSGQFQTREHLADQRRQLILRIAALLGQLELARGSSYPRHNRDDSAK
jgi:hypothetical protein